MAAIRASSSVTRPSRQATERPDRTRLRRPGQRPGGGQGGSGASPGLELVWEGDCGRLADGLVHLPHKAAGVLALVWGVLANDPVHVPREATGNPTPESANPLRRGPLPPCAAGE